MSKIFYDHLIVYEQIEVVINQVSQSPEEKQDLWQIIDEMIHHKVLDFLLSKLPKDSHREFMDKFLSAPHDEDLFNYLNQKIGTDVEKLVKEELASLAANILKEIKT